jgi:predicted flap endonuclease-1-like 5' DNA nuclease
MIYLIGQLGFWLIMTALFAALAGWAMAARRAVPDTLARTRTRENLVRDLAKLAEGDFTADVGGAEREGDAMRRLIEVRDGRISELETLLAAARARADEAAARIAELERAPATSPQENDELIRLRALTTEYEADRAREVEVVAQPVVEDEATAVQAWRLRYFEQRVKYLEGKSASVVEKPSQPPEWEWRAREAEARAAHLESEVRSAPSEAEPVEAFAANAEIDMMLRWRMLYLERRAAYLQDEAARAAELEHTLGARMATEAELKQRVGVLDEELARRPLHDPQAERWKWRSRFLEARVRHLERQAPTVRAVAAPLAEPAPQAPAPVREKPRTLPGPRNGAPDDFTLIEDVSVLQQTTLYSLGVFHFDQVAAWSPANVAWVDNYLRLRGRIDAEEWVEQADALAREGVGASRRMLIEEDA